METSVLRFRMIPDMRFEQIYGQAKRSLGGKAGAVCAYMSPSFDRVLLRTLQDWALADPRDSCSLALAAE